MRLMAIGNQALMDGFALLGIETHSDISTVELDQLLNDLNRKQEKVLIYLQQNLAETNLPILRHLRNEGGLILISVIPDILSANDYRAPVDLLISRVLGKNIDTGTAHG